MEVNKTNLLEFPKELTYEEKELKSKYKILRELKEKMSLLSKQKTMKDSSELLTTVDRFQKCSQEDLKKTALRVLQESEVSKKIGNARKSTKDFKKAFKQSGETHVGQKR